MDQELTYWRDFSRDKKTEWAKTLEEGKTELERLSTRGMRVDGEAQHARARSSQKAMQVTRDMHKAKCEVFAKRN